MSEGKAIDVLMLRIDPKILFTRLSLKYISVASSTAGLLTPLLDCAIIAIFYLTLTAIFY